MRRDVLLLDGATRVLQAFDVRRSLDSRASGRSKRAAVVVRPVQPHIFAQQPRRLRRSLRRAPRGPCALSTGGSTRADAFPTSPYWHRECLTCEFSDHCQSELEARDDVSLTRFTSIDQQAALREHGVTTRTPTRPARPLRAHAARANLSARGRVVGVEERLSRSVRSTWTN